MLDSEKVQGYEEAKGRPIDEKEDQEDQGGVRRSVDIASFQRINAAVNNDRKQAERDEKGNEIADFEQIAVDLVQKESRIDRKQNGCSDCQEMFLHGMITGCSPYRVLAAPVARVRRWDQFQAEK